MICVLSRFRLLCEKPTTTTTITAMNTTTTNTRMITMTKTITTITGIITAMKTITIITMMITAMKKDCVAASYGGMRFSAH